MLVHRWKINQTVAGLIIALGGFGYGCGLAWTATALPSYEESGTLGPISAVEKSWIGSLFTIGALIGCPIAGLMMTHLGRKMCLWAYCYLGFAGWMLLAGATSPTHVYIGRILTGISIGGFTIVAPVFISEIAGKNNRGLMGSFFLIMACLGKLFSNAVGSIFPAHFASLLCAVHPLLYGALLLLIPESPTSLLKWGKDKDAYNSLRWLESTGFTLGWMKCVSSPTQVDSQVAREIKITSRIENIKLATSLEGGERRPSVTAKEFFSSAELLKPVLIVLVEMLLAQFCGINVSTFYTVEIFELCGGMVIDPRPATVILGGIQVLGGLPCSILVDRYGRRMLLTSSFFAMAVGMAGLTGYFYVMEEYPEVLVELPWLSLTPLISLVIYNLAYSWGVGSIIWIVMGEILPSKIIGPASAIANATFWGAAFAITQTFQMLRDDLPIHLWFLLFCIISLAGCFFNLWALPETKGLTLNEIQAFWTSSKQQNSKESNEI